MNKIILSCLFAILICQLYKVLFNDKQINLRNFFKTGSMPSSHSAIVTALCLSLYLYDGFSTLLIVSCVFGAIVLRDSSNRHNIKEVVAGILSGLLITMFVWWI